MLRVIADNQMQPAINTQTSQTDVCVGTIEAVGSSYVTSFGCTVGTISSSERVVPSVVLRFAMNSIRASVNNSIVMTYFYNPLSDVPYYSGEPAGVTARYRGGFQQSDNAAYVNITLYNRSLSIDYTFTVGVGLTNQLIAAKAVGNLLSNSTTGQPAQPTVIDDSIQIPHNNGMLLHASDGDVPRISLEAMDASQGDNFGESFYTVGYQETSWHVQRRQC